MISILCSFTNIIFLCLKENNNIETRLNFIFREVSLIRHKIFKTKKVVQHFEMKSTHLQIHT